MKFFERLVYNKTRKKLEKGQLNSHDKNELLRSAVSHDYAQVAKLLIDHNTSPDIVDTNGGIHRIIHDAAYGKRFKCVDILIEAGADLNYTPNGLSFWETTLTVLAQKGRFDLVKKALDKGADPLLPNHKGDSVYVYAIKEKLFDLIKIIEDTLATRQNAAQAGFIDKSANTAFNTAATTLQEDVSTKKIQFKVSNQPNIQA